MSTNESYPSRGGEQRITAILSHANTGMSPLFFVLFAVPFKFFFTSVILFQVKARET